MIRISVEVDRTLAAIPKVARQIEFATAQALQDVAFIARDAERSRAQGLFTIRRPWVLQGIQVARPFPTRDNLTAIIEVEQHRSFLNKFEPGGTRKPTGAHLAIPDEEGLDTSKVIPRGKRPKAFGFTLHTTASGKRQYKGKQRTFILETAKGEGIFQRTGKGQGSNVRLLYWLATSAHIDPVLRFHETVRTVVERAFHSRFAERFAAALRTAR